jgi:hypothetical protein
MSAERKDVGEVVVATMDPGAFLLFDPDRVTALKGIRVFDVGQGDCIGLRDQDERIFCYIDYGGLCDHPDKGDPANTAARLPVGAADEAATIVLTHWDKDHFWSASKNAAAREVPWLVPRQHVSPRTAQFASRLPHAVCWPESLQDRPETFYIGRNFELQIRKCAPFDAQQPQQDRNLSGLAVTLVKRERDGPDQVMILPGDCPFDRIPRLPRGRIVAVVAYHHGSATYWTPATAQVLVNGGRHLRWIYSFGINSHGHPREANYAGICVHCNGEARTTQLARQQGEAAQDASWRNQSGW